MHYTGIKIIDPHKLPPDLYFVLSDDKLGIFGWGIRNHDGGNWSHSMTSRSPFCFNSQTLLGYKEIPVTNYLTSRYSLKYWKIKNLTTKEKWQIEIMIKKRLSQPWYKNRYDFLGIIGQAIGIKWFQSPWAKYCSEGDAEYLRKIGIMAPKEPSPSELDYFYKKHERMEYVGHWFMD